MMGVPSGIVSALTTFDRLSEGRQLFSNRQRPLSRNSNVEWRGTTVFWYSLANL